jgi:hypothetical protein
LGDEVKTTEYFLRNMRKSDRSWIKMEWIERTLNNPEWENEQKDGRFQRRARIPEANNRVLRVVVLPDGETVHNALFDRSFKHPKPEEEK